MKTVSPTLLIRWEKLTHNQGKPHPQSCENSPQQNLIHSSVKIHTDESSPQQTLPTAWLKTHPAETQPSKTLPTACWKLTLVKTHASKDSATVWWKLTPAKLRPQFGENSPQWKLAHSLVKTHPGKISPIGWWKLSRRKLHPQIAENVPWWKLIPAKTCPQIGENSPMLWSSVVTVSRYYCCCWFIVVVSLNLAYATGTHLQVKVWQWARNMRYASHTCCREPCPHITKTPAMQAMYSMCQPVHWSLVQSGINSPMLKYSVVIVVNVAVVVRLTCATRTPVAREQVERQCMRSTRHMCHSPHPLPWHALKCSPNTCHAMHIHMVQSDLTKLNSDEAHYHLYQVQGFPCTSIQIIKEVKDWISWPVSKISPAVNLKNPSYSLLSDMPLHRTSCHYRHSPSKL